MDENIVKTDDYKQEYCDGYKKGRIDGFDLAKDITVNTLDAIKDIKEITEQHTMKLDTDKLFKELTNEI
jgi:hypothetical protein